MLIQEKGYRSVSFATPLKNMAKHFLMDAGFWPSEAGEYVYGSKKDEVVPGFEFTGRDLQLAIGEELRALDSQVWVKFAKRRIQKLQEQGFPVVVDDMRRVNEQNGMDDLGAVSVFIYRDRSPYQADSRGTEGQLNADEADYSISNEDDEETLRERMCDLHALIHSEQMELL